MSVVAAIGYGLNYWAWTLVGPLGPELAHRYGLGGGTLTVLAAVAVAAGSLGRLPVGALADRYGPRAVLPVLSVAAAVPVASLAAVETLPEVVVAACACAVAGTAFAAGSVLVARAYPPGRRGLALSVFGAGMGLASAAGIASRSVFAFDRHHGLLLLAALLVGYAVATALVVPGAPAREPRTEPLRQILDVLRLPAARHLSIWYAIANGGLVALDLYLPDYLGRAYDVGWATGTVCAALCLGVGALGQPFGGWLSGRTDPVRVLGGCFAAVGFFALILAFHPPLASVAGPAAFAIAACLGTAGGTVLWLIGHSAPIRRIGTVAGMIGAVGGLAGLVPPLLLAAVYGIEGSYGIGLTLLSAAAVAAAWKLRVQRYRLGVMLAFPDDGEPRLNTTAVVALTDRPTHAHGLDILSAVAALAVRQEVVVVCRPAAPGKVVSGHALVAGLRNRLPRHTVVAVEVSEPLHPHELAVVGELLEVGALAIAVVAGDPAQAAVLVADALNIPQIVAVSADRMSGAALRQLRSADLAEV